MCSSITGTRPEWFARAAAKFVVNIDESELDAIEIPGVNRIYSDVSDFLDLLVRLTPVEAAGASQRIRWLTKLDAYKAYNFIGESSGTFVETEYVNPYRLLHEISVGASSSDLFVVDGGGTVVYSSMQCLQVKEEQKIILSSGLCSMGSGIPEAIGAWCARPQNITYCFVGDGSFPFNVQELALIKRLNANIKIFVINNGGYLSIRSTQNDFLEGRYAGSTVQTGLGLVDVEKVSASFGLRYERLSFIDDLSNIKGDIFGINGPMVIEVQCDPEQEIVPRQYFKRQADGAFLPQPLENMAPPIELNVLQNLMEVPLLNLGTES